MNFNFTPYSIPWLCGGHFNEIIWDFEKLNGEGGGTQMLHNRPRHLGNFMNCTELMNLDFNGLAFIWRGARNGVLIEEHIDRGILNS